MQISACGANAQLDRQHALEAHEDHRSAACIDLPEFPPAEVSLKAWITFLKEAYERRTSDFLFALDDPDQAEG
ncbi:hypothetical protein N182_21680 [Sinorhizobium sp. GL2]|nr:hypothetical protein N182_21680 [Sinorhizobium sp. GL2]